MQASKLIQLLSSLGTRERTRFKQYILSPFFNKHEKISELCQYILGFAPEFDQEALNRGVVHSNLFPEEDYNEDKLNNLISDLLQLLYDYLAYLVYEQQPLQKQLQLLEALLERDQSKHFSRAERRMEQLMKKLDNQSYAHFQYNMAFAELKDRFAISKKRRAFNPHLQEANNALDSYYWVNKFRMACDMLSRNVVIKASYEAHFLDTLLALYQEQAALQQIPALKVYHEGVQLLSQSIQERDYQKYTSVLAEHGEAIPHEELQTLYNYALNHCIQMINSGDNSYYDQIFSLYQTMIEKEIIFSKGVLSEWAYKNIVTTGIRLKAFDWTEGFIHQYQERLEASSQTNALAYNLAAFYYAKADYKKALIQLQDVEFTDSSYHLGAKIIQLKSYYELEETEAFYALIEAFQKYLRRSNQISDYRKRANKNLLQLSKKAYKLRAEYDLIRPNQLQKRKIALLRKLGETSPIANKSWLEEILDRL